MFSDAEEIAAPSASGTTRTGARRNSELLDINEHTPIAVEQSPPDQIIRTT
jgi:hypothetical protein